MNLGLLTCPCISQSQPGLEAGKAPALKLSKSCASRHRIQWSHSLLGLLQLKRQSQLRIFPTDSLLKARQQGTCTMTFQTRN